ncbi:MAG: FISUMP domain-containing protein [Mangrovibacterium sp.]
MGRKYKINPVTGKHDLISEESLVVQSAPQEAVEFGLLYNHHAAIDERGLANIGWRVPTFDELFYDLAAHVGDISTSGGILKSTDDMFFNAPNVGATNAVNFNGVGSGIRDSDGLFYNLKLAAYLMASDLGDGRIVSGALLNGVIGILLMRNEAGLGIYNGGDQYEGTSIRLVREATPDELLLNDGSPCANYVGNDGRSYGTVKIGDKVWMNENLAETKFANGDPITEVTDTNTWIAQTTAAMCKYNNDAENVFREVIPERSVNLAAGEKLILGESLSGTGTESDPLGVNPAVLPEQLWEPAGTDAIKPVDTTKKVLIGSDSADDRESKVQINSGIYLHRIASMQDIPYDNNVVNNGITMYAYNHSGGLGYDSLMLYDSNGYLNLTAPLKAYGHAANPIDFDLTLDCRKALNQFISAVSQSIELSLSALPQGASGAIIVKHYNADYKEIRLVTDLGAIAATAAGNGKLPLHTFGPDYYSVIRWTYMTPTNFFATVETVSSTGSPVPDPARQSNTDLDTGTEVIATVPVATYDAVFFDYKVKKGANLRAGTIMAVTDGVAVNYTEMGTTDLGDTSALALSVDLDGGNIRLLGTATTDDWEIQTLIRGL